MSKMWFFLHGDDKTEIVFKEASEIKPVFSRSIGYNTEQELIEGEKILPDRCPICGNHVKTNWAEPLATKLKTTGICFDCNFWDEIEKDKDNPRRFFIDGVAYWMKDDVPKGYGGFVGFGGCKFVIKKHTGEVITTHNLWHNGKISAAFKDKLKDNAEFIK